MLIPVNLCRSLASMALSIFVLVAQINSSRIPRGARESLLLLLFSRTSSLLVGDFQNIPAKDQVVMSAHTVSAPVNWFGLSTRCRILVSLVVTPGAPARGRIEWGRTSGRQIGRASCRE